MFVTDDLPSSDSESEFGGNTRSKRTNLGSIFASTSKQQQQQPVEASQKTEATQAQVKTLLSASITSFLKTEPSEEWVPYGKLGLALLMQQNALRIVLYTPDKRPVHQIVLQRGEEFRHQLSFNGLYIYFHRVPEGEKQLSIVFAEAQREALLTFAAWVLLFSGNKEPIKINEGSGEQAIDIGDSVLLEVTQFTEEAGELLKTSEEQRIRVREKSGNFQRILAHTLGLKKGAQIFVTPNPGEALLIVVKKHKKANDDTRSTLDAGSEKDRSVTPSSEIVESTVVAEEEITGKISPAKNSVLERMAKLGQPILGMAPLQPPKLDLPEVKPEPVEQRASDFQDEAREEEAEVAPAAAEPQPAVKPDVPIAETSQETGQRTFNETPPLLTYEMLHRVIGVEMDRLEGRLERRFMGILERINGRLARLEGRLKPDEYGPT